MTILNFYIYEFGGVEFFKGLHNDHKRHENSAKKVGEFLEISKVYSDGLRILHIQLCNDLQILCVVFFFSL